MCDPSVLLRLRRRLSCSASPAPACLLSRKGESRAEDGEVTVTQVPRLYLIFPREGAGSFPSSRAIGETGRPPEPGAPRMALGWDAMGGAEGQAPTPGQSLGALMRQRRLVLPQDNEEIYKEEVVGSEGLRG